MQTGGDSTTAIRGKKRQDSTTSGTTPHITLGHRKPINWRYTQQDHFTIAHFRIATLVINRHTHRSKSTRHTHKSHRAPLTIHRNKKRTSRQRTRLPGLWFRASASRFEKGRESLMSDMVAISYFAIPSPCGVLSFLLPTPFPLLASPIGPVLPSPSGPSIPIHCNLHKKMEHL